MAEKFTVQVRGRFLTNPNSPSYSDCLKDAFVFAVEKTAVFTAQTIHMMQGEPTTVHANRGSDNEVKIFDSETWAVPESD